MLVVLVFVVLSVFVLVVLVFFRNIPSGTGGRLHHVVCLALTQIHHNGRIHLTGPGPVRQYFCCLAGPPFSLGFSGPFYRSYKKTCLTGVSICCLMGSSLL